MSEPSFDFARLWAHLAFVVALVAAGWTFVVMGIVSDIRDDIHDRCSAALIKEEE